MKLGRNNFLFIIIIYLTLLFVLNSSYSHKIKSLNNDNAKPIEAKLQNAKQRLSDQIISQHLDETKKEFSSHNIKTESELKTLNSNTSISNSVVVKK